MFLDRIREDIRSVLEEAERVDAMKIRRYFFIMEKHIQVRHI